VPLIIAIDGPSGSGKSSTSRGVAERLGLRYVDTGAMYRAMTWWMLAHGVDVDNPAAIAARCHEPVIELRVDPGDPGVSVDGNDVSVDIRAAGGRRCRESLGGRARSACAAGRQPARDGR